MAASTGPTTPEVTAACSATPWPGTRAANEPSQVSQCPENLHWESATKAGAFNKEKAQLGTSSGHFNTSRRFVDNSTRFGHTKRGDIYDVSGIRTCGGQRYSNCWNKRQCVSYSGSGFHCPNINFNLQERVDHKRFKNVTSWGACSNICRERPFCKYWVWHDATKVELQTKFREYIIITEKIPTRAFSWLRAPTTCTKFTKLN